MISVKFRSLTVPSLLAIGLLSACSGDGSSEKKAIPPQTVTAAKLQLRSMTGGLSASGRIVPREEMAVAADLSGYRIAKVLVEEGAVVRAGQPLAVLDDSLLTSQILQLRATSLQQRVAAEQAREQASRVDGLDGQGVISGEAIATRKYAARTASAAESATKAQLNDLLVRQRHLVIVAPASGLILERTARPGETSSSGSTLFTMARDSMFELYAELPEADAASVHVGDEAQVILASGRKLAGRVRLIGERVDQNTGLMIARIALPNSVELRQGGFAKATFMRTVQVPALPEAAVRYDADGPSIMVIDKDSRVERRKVQTGRHMDGFIELRAGPPVGSRVAVKGAAFTLDGDKVAVAGAGK